MSSFWIVDSLRALISDIDECTALTRNAVDGYKWKIELMCTDLMAKETICGQLCTLESSALNFLSKAYKEMDALLDKLVAKGEDCCSSFQAPLMLSGAVGRPTYVIPEDQLQSLIESHFTVPQISKILGVSISTIRRRMSSLNLSVQSTYSQITNAELDNIVGGAQQQYPNWGNRQMYGYLVSRGIRVPIHRARESQRRVDPEGCVLRSLRSLRRRIYSVQGPQHLWHIDGNHKLIRYAVYVDTVCSIIDDNSGDIITVSCMVLCIIFIQVEACGPWCHRWV